ncbi:MAG: ABC transporter permease [Hyphomicrobiales bacterium]
MTTPDLATPTERQTQSESGSLRQLSDVSSSTMALMQVALGIATLVAWQLASDRLLPDYMISNPLSVAQRLWTWITTGSILVHLVATLHAAVAGFVIGSVVGIVGGIWLGLSPFFSRLLNPYIWAFNSLPKVALVPLFVLWFGLGINSKIALAAVLVVFLVFVSTYSGVREVDSELVDSLRLMRAKRHHLLTKVILPSATSWIFAGLKVAVPYSLIGAIIGELVAANRGLGYLVQRSGAEFDTAGVFAALVVIAILAMIFNGLVVSLQGRLERWKVVGR